MSTPTSHLFQMAFWLGIILGHLSLLTTCLANQVLGHGGGYPQPAGAPSNSCNYFEGSWVYDNTYPLYNSSICPFIGQGFDCQANGRPDQDYLKYRWQPTGCQIPRFDGLNFLEKHKGKKIMFVGDSLSNNMWVSLACLLHAAVPLSNYTISRAGLRSTFSLPEYNLSLIWLKNGFLVDFANEKVGRVLKLNSVSSAPQWLGMDVLIFNTYHWWFHSGRLQPWDYIQTGDKLLKDMDRLEALKFGLKTWAGWIDYFIDPLRTKVFFQGVAATHLDPKKWNETNPEARTCMGQTKPVLGPKYPGPRIQGEDVIKEVIGKMANPAYLLDIAPLTQLRKDGHPSIYAGRGSKLKDCSHWCLAGVPDTWNQLLYAALLRR